MFAIYKKEFKSIFNSMIGWMFLAVNLFFAGWYFRYNGMINGYPYTSYILSGILLIFLCSMPMLTMRSFAEESKNRTDQLLFTSPISTWKIILGKYLALVSLLVFMLLVIGVYQFILKIYGDVPVSENFLAILGFLLFGMACISIGVFLSSVTENQIIAAVLTFFVLMVGIMISGICNLISATGNWITRILNIFNLTKWLQNFLYGIIYLPGILYYISVVILMLCLTAFVLTRKRMNFASHGFMKVAGSFLGILIVVAILLILNVAIRFLPKDTITRDITYNSIYSITDASKEILKNLNADINFYILVDGDNEDTTLKNTIEAMASESSRIKINYISPSQNPYFYSNYSDVNPADNSVIVVSGEKSTVVDYYDCYEMTYDYEYDYASGGYVVKSYNVTGYDGEGQLMSAIDYVTSDIIPKAYAITGHDEFQLAPTLQDKFDKQNIEIDYLNLLTYDSIPEDADFILILGPLADYTNEEVDKVTAYLQNGGNALFVVSYTDSDELYNYYSILEDYNIKVNPGLVMEQGSSFYNQQQYYLLPEIVDTPITEEVYTSSRNKYIYMPFSKGLSVTDDNKDVTNIVFLQTTENAYLQTDNTASNEAGNEENYDTNQYALGIFAEKIYPEASSRIIAFSSDYYLYEDVNMVVNDNNYNVFMKSINQLVDKSYVSNIPVKNYSFDPIVMDETARTLASVFVIGIIPAIFLLTGFFIWLDRRRR